VRAVFIGHILDNHTRRHFDHAQGHTADTLAAGLRRDRIFTQRFEKARLFFFSLLREHEASMLPVSRT
jgi:hypothetical protein